MLREPAAAAVLALLAALLLHMTVFRDKKRTLAALLFGVYLAVMLAVTGFPRLPHVTFDPDRNLIPFYNVKTYLLSAFLNIVMFVPLGFLLPFFWAFFRKCGRTLAAGLFLTVFIETAQLFTHRFTDINDVITNLLGAAAGYLLARLFTKGFTKRTLPGTKTGDPVWMFLAVTVLFFTALTPFLNLTARL